VLKPVVAFKGQPVDPFDFLDEATPANVVAFFSEDVDFNKPGRADVTLTLNDGTKRGNVTARLYILEVARVVKRESGTQYTPLTANDFIPNIDILPVGVNVEAKILTDLSDTDFFDTGNYNVELKVNGKPFNSTLALVDTTPPTATVIGMTINLGTPVEASDFVKDIADASPVSVTFLEEPDVFDSGEQMLTVVLTDDYGNATNLNSMLKIKHNLEPPRFSGLRDMEALLNDPVMYRKGVTAHDSFGNELEFEVDSSAVDVTTPGEYPVVYTVTDADGHAIKQTITIKVVNVTEEAITEKLDSVMSSIISEGMTQREQARAIFDWIRGHVTYTNDGPKESVYEGAYRALQFGQGDCFTFYAIAEVMLNNVGIPNQCVTRIEGTRTQHFWNLVNCDDGGWYHFDSTPNAVHSIDRFMFTDGDALNYTEIILKETNARDYYTYDKTLHPEVIQ
jgi:hypothetical protein